MLCAKEFVDTLECENEALFKASEIQVEAFFESEPSREELVSHFSGRCVNEYLNMIEIAKRLVRIAGTQDRKLIRSLARQIADEANHYDMVAEVLERLTGAPLNTDRLLDQELDGGDAKGARSLQKMEDEDLPALYTYQFIAEGRAYRVWQRMADIIDDEFIATRYAKIAKDELFHSQIGRRGLSKVAVTRECQSRVMQLASDIRHELFQVSCQNCTEVAEAREICVSAYGSRFAA